MARADLEKLRKRIQKKIMDDPGDFRLFYANKKELTIRNSNKSIIDQCMKQMALREAYDTPGQLKIGLDKRFPGENAFSKLETDIKREVPLFNGDMFTRLSNQKNKKGGLFKIDFHEGSTPENWTIDFSRKNNQGKLFQEYKVFKAKAQVNLINAINAWSMTKSGGGQARDALGQYASGKAGGGSGDTYSRRGIDLTGATTKEEKKKQAAWNRKMGANVPIIKKGKIVGYREARREVTKKGDVWKKQDGTEGISNAFDPFLDLGHTEAAVAGERLIVARESFTDYEGSISTLGAAGTRKGTVAEELKLRLGAELNWEGEGAKRFDVEWESSSLNKASAGTAKNEVTKLDFILNKIIQELHEEMGGWENAESSDSFMQMTEKKLIESLIGPLRKRKGVKIQTRLKKTNIQKNSKTKAKETKYKPKRSKEKIPFRIFPKGKIKPATKSPARATTGTANAPLFLLGIFNEQLPQMVEANMGSPALTNRTGRFASSVRATDIAMTPKGFPSFGYTYRRDPYETFEQNTNYDPRTLIDRTMREIAAEYAIGRFYTRRV